MDDEGDDGALRVQLAVVFDGQEYAVETAAVDEESAEASVDVSLELLQCQLMSLLGLAPDEQVLLASDGRVLCSPNEELPPVLKVSKASRTRLFLLHKTAAESADGGASADWREICTKCTFGDAQVVQPAFRKPGDARKALTLVCGPCARTCSTAFQPVLPLEWSELPAVSSRFISDIALVAGEVDVPAPAGFTKLPGDLNFAADGDYVYLCVKRGGTHVLTQLQVQSSEPLTKSVRTQSQFVASVDYNVDSGLLVIGYDTEALVDATTSGNLQAITDISIIYGDEQPVPAGFIKIPTKVNGTTAEIPVYLCYRLAPIGGFMCDSGRDHSDFGECLFASRFRPVKEQSVSTLRERASLSDERKKIDSAQMDAHYMKHQPAMLKRLQDGIQRVQSYESKTMQEEALKHIPVALLEERARANPSPMALFKDEVLMQLLHWFKREFFTWMNQPRCSSCNHEKTRAVRTEGPKTAEEVAGQAGRVEVYQCPNCSSFTRFPRYNDPVKLLTSRTGRCGEWANCFTLCCRAMGYEARYVLDVTDHVWTEVYSEHFKRWLHCDSCEDQLDSPLTYEVGWGKKLSYIFSFGRDEVVDSARRYTQNWEAMRSRRRDVSEEWLKATIFQINKSLRQNLPSDRVGILTDREKVEQDEFRRGRTVKKSEVQGRVSGSAEWKSGRQEDGKTGSDARGETAADSTKHEDNNKPSKAEILQEIFRNLVVGCGNISCKNPYCAHCPPESANIKSTDPNERAAGAIQAAASLNEKFSSSGLSMLLCSKNSQDIRTFVFEYCPDVYYPLQDASIDSLLDISGHGHHIERDNRKLCTGAMQKPFRLPQSGPDGVAFGMQLLTGQRLTFANPSINDHVISLLLRMDDVNLSTQDFAEEERSVCLEITNASDSDSATVYFQVTQDYDSKKLTCRLRYQSQEAEKLSQDTASLVFGRYYHLALAVSDKHHVVFIDGVKNTQLFIDKQLREDGKSESAYTMSCSGPRSHAVTISHLAVLPLGSVGDPEAFGRKMAQQFVAAPPLRAYGPTGKIPDKRCSEQVANARSGYRVSRIHLWGEQFLDGVQFIYSASHDLDEKPIVQGALIGNANAKRAADSPTTTFELWEDEVITGVSGRKGAWMDSITFTTNYGRETMCGGYGGGEFKIELSPGSEVRAMAFNTGDHLTSPVAFVIDDAFASTPLKSSTVMAELRVILSPKSPSLRQNAVLAVTRYLGNIAAQPGELKFQRIRASNRFFVMNIAILGEPVASNLMAWSGFVVDPASEGSADKFYIFKPLGGEKEANVAKIAEQAQRRSACLKMFLAE